MGHGNKMHLNSRKTFNIVVDKEANAANILNNTEQKLPFISKAPPPKVPVHIKPKPKYQNASSSIPNGFSQAAVKQLPNLDLTIKNAKVLISQLTKFWRFITRYSAQIGKTIKVGKESK